VINILGKENCFGEMAATDETPNSTDVITLLPQLRNMPAQDFLSISESLAGVRLSQLMARRLHDESTIAAARILIVMLQVADALLF